MESTTSYTFPVQTGGIFYFPWHRHQIEGTSSSSVYCAGQRSTPHYRTLEVRPGRITKKLELKYDYDCERDDTNSLLGVLMFGWDIVIANNE